MPLQSSAKCCHKDVIADCVRFDVILDQIMYGHERIPKSQRFSKVLGLSGSLHSASESGGSVTAAWLILCWLLNSRLLGILSLPGALYELCRPWFQKEMGCIKRLASSTNVNKITEATTFSMTIPLLSTPCTTWLPWEFWHLKFQWEHKLQNCCTEGHLREITHDKCNILRWIPAMKSIPQVISIRLGGGGDSKAAVLKLSCKVLCSYRSHVWHHRA